MCRIFGVQSSGWRLKIVCWRSWSQLCHWNLNSTKVPTFSVHASKFTHSFTKDACWAGLEGPARHEQPSEDCCVDVCRASGKLGTVVMVQRCYMSGLRTHCNLSSQGLRQMMSQMMCHAPACLDAKSLGTQMFLPMKQASGLT